MVCKMKTEDKVKLVNLVEFISSDANTQIDRYVPLINLMRVVNGDLSHLYDGIISGRRLFNKNGYIKFIKSNYKFELIKHKLPCGIEVESFNEEDLKHAYAGTTHYPAYSVYFDLILCKYCVSNHTINISSDNRAINKFYFKKKVDAEKVASFINSSLNIN